jgi:hypothetical protein
VAPVSPIAHIVKMTVILRNTILSLGPEFVLCRRWDA